MIRFQKKHSLIWLWILIVPWFSYLYFQVDFVYSFFFLKAVLPLLLLSMVIGWLYIMEAKIERSFVVIYGYVAISILIGAINGSLFSATEQFGRFVWLLAIPGLAFVLKKVLGQQSFQVCFQTTKAMGRDYRSVFLVTAIAIFSIFIYKDFIYDSDKCNESWAMACNNDKGETVRLPTVAGMVIILFAYCLFVRGKKYFSLLLVSAGVAIYVAAFARSGVVLSIIFFLYLVWDRKNKLGDFRPFFKFSVFVNTISISTVFISPFIDSLEITSWYTRYRSISFAISSLNDAGAFGWCWGIGVVGRRENVENLPSFFWSSDIWFFGIVYEFGLVGLFAYWSMLTIILLNYLKLVRHVFSEYKPTYIGHAVMLLPVMYIANYFFSFLVFNPINFAFAMATVAVIATEYRQRSLQ